ncbi:cytochrome c oxidase subunit 5B, mitochondrial-like [Neomonachus schauinslandi]|uniref:Cytochrome c oxidase subunit 5B, mitochondrial n=1 Tax=Neomonachus schauinslandi TaxID=29088 RepID=A0A8M1M205_NEOSC|nr:cytochrome c oxidase subunit 5B, mitochondrial-like [Neomonachus schauinslandi]
MASRLLRGIGVLAMQDLSGVTMVHFMASAGGVPTETSRQLGWRGHDDCMEGARPINMLAPQATSGTKEDPNLVPSITNKQIVGCIFEEDNSAFICFWLHKGEIQ